MRWFVLVCPDVLDAPDARDDTPLHLAATKGDADMVDALLRAGADATAKQAKGRTAMDLAYDECRTRKGRQTKCNEIIELLKRHGARGGGAEDD